MHPKMRIGESLSFYDDGILMPLYCGKGGICYVSKPEEVWHLVLHPCGVALSATLFGKGRGVETPLSLIFLIVPKDWQKCIRKCV